MLKHIDKTQPEFSFAQPFLEKQQKQLDDYMKMWDNLARLYSKRHCNIDLADIFKDDPIDWDHYYGPSFPITIVVGERDQLEFSFSRALEEAAWKCSKGPVKFHYELCN